MTEATPLQLMGAGCFGAVIGWFLYFLLNRYRTEEIKLFDLITLIGAIGGGAILAIFPERTDLFGAYGIGLAIGFFGYFLLLALMVWKSKSFNVEWFLDGRRRALGEGEIGPGGADAGGAPAGGRPMGR